MKNIKKMLMVLAIIGVINSSVTYIYAGTVGDQINAEDLAQLEVPENDKIYLIENIDQMTVVNMSPTITDSQLEEIVSDVDVVVNDGDDVEVDSVITIRDEEFCKDSFDVQVTTALASDGTQKIISDTDRKSLEGVEATVYLEMKWTDRPGPQNRLDTITGRLNILKGKVERGTLMYGNFATASTLKQKSKTSDFTEYIYMDYLKPTASWEIHFKDAIFSLTISVTATVFD